MKLFTIGPVEMYKHTLEIGNRPIPYFRTEEFSNLMQDTDALLKKLIGTAKSSKTVYLTASGTGAMEAAIMNCLNREDKVLIISGGTFGRRFEEICDVHELNYDTIHLASGEGLNETHLEKYARKGYTALLVNLHETSTGQLYDIEMISNFCRKNSMYLIVDAISTFLCDTYEMDKYHIDVTIISSQKGLCLPPGISTVILGENILKERVEKINPQSVYFNFKAYISNMERGQTPFTPAVGILVQLNDMLHQIDKMGLDSRLNQVQEICEDFRNHVQCLPITLPQYKLSNGITPIIFNQEIAMDIFQILKNQYHIFVNPTGGEMQNKVLRVAHIGALIKEDNRQLIALMEKCIKER